MNLIQHCVFAVTRTSDLAPEYISPSQAGEIPWAWIIASGAIAIGFGIVLAISKSRKLPALSVSDDVTLDLCRAHGIGLQHRYALESIASRASLAHTAEMFLSPQLFDAAVTKANQSKRLGMRQRGLVYEARKYVFG